MKSKDKTIKIDLSVYKLVKQIAKKDKRKIKAVIAVCVYDYWNKI